MHSRDYVNVHANDYANVHSNDYSNIKGIAHDQARKNSPKSKLKKTTENPTCLKQTTYHLLSVLEEGQVENLLGPKCQVMKEWTDGSTETKLVKLGKQYKFQ